MKKLFIVLIAMVFVLSAATVFAGVSNTKHNLTNASATTGAKADAGQGETLCGFCHIPHGGNYSITGVPLWARSIRDTAASPYQVYGGGSAAAGTTLSGTAVGQPGANSLTCLSCHDGTISVGTVQKYGVSTSWNMTDGTAPDYLNGSDQLIFVAGQAYQPNLVGDGVDLQNDHPVGITYSDAGNNYAGLDTLANATGRGYRFYGGTSDRMECGSCHDPHTEITSFKRVDPIAGGFDFCVGCHWLK